MLLARTSSVARLFRFRFFAAFEINAQFTERSNDASEFCSGGRISSRLLCVLRLCGKTFMVPPVRVPRKGAKDAKRKTVV